MAAGRAADTQLECTRSDIDRTVKLEGVPQGNKYSEPSYDDDDIVADRNTIRVFVSYC